jgi:hypothetical protein
MSAGVELHYRSAGTGTPAVILSGGPGLTVDYMVPHHWLRQVSIVHAARYAG